MKMSNFLSDLIIFCILLSAFVYGQEEIRNKICVENADRDACQQISRNLEFACLEDIISKVDCFINIDQNEPQFTIVNAEQALLAAPLVSEKVVVLAEIKSEDIPFQTAVVVRKPYEGTFENLRGKRFCYPGYRRDDLVTRYVLEELESKILDTINYCNTADNITLLEKRTRALASFWGASCKPGIWSESDELDAKLKSIYSNLCDLCGIQKCNIDYITPFNDTLGCLTQKGGDIALTTLQDAIAFFGTSNNADNYQYLCPNGSVSNANITCTWTNQLDRLIVTGSEFAATVTTYLRTHLSASPATTVTPSLQKVLDIAKKDVVNILSSTVSLRTYVEAQRNISSNETAACKQTVKWCTLNELEQQKCLWLQRASINTGLKPLIECKQTSHNESLLCLNDIEVGDADMAFNDVNYGYTALKKGLSLVAYTETDKRQLSAILIVVKNDSTSINNLNDLKNKRACFPEYGGKEWLAFIDVLITKQVLPDSCDYGKSFSNFVGESCLPGAIEQGYDIQNTDVSKLCAHCVPVQNTGTAVYCNADAGNKYYGSDGALRCLANGDGDFAVITRNDVYEYFNDSSAFRVLSKNGSISQYTGIHVDDKAALTILTAGGVVAKNDSSKREDIILLLRGIESEFGLNLLKVFKVFEKFNNTKDLLFPDSTPGLTFGGLDIEYVENFKSLLSNSEKCITNTNGAAINVPSIFGIILPIICSYFILIARL